MGKLRIIGAIFLISVLIFLFLFLSALVKSNTLGRLLVCEDTLKVIFHAIELYRADFNGDQPPSLLELKPYIEKRYLHGEQGLPGCVGNRNEDETSDTWEYCYYPSLSKEIRPICWDSQPHCLKSLLGPDIYIWNVLYSDGRVERLHEREFFRELSILISNKPDLLTQMKIPDERSTSAWPAFFLGIIVGVFFLYSVLSIKKMTRSK